MTLNKYSRKEFEGYTHRFKVRFMVDQDYRNDSTIDIYTDSGDYAKMDAFINQNKSSRVVHFRVEHRATKEQDEADSKFIEEILKSL